jgi:hypothetical protein
MWTSLPTLGLNGVKLSGFPALLSDISTAEWSAGQ